MAGPLVALLAALRTAGPALAQGAGAFGRVASGSASNAANVGGMSAQLSRLAGTKANAKTIALESIELARPQNREERSQRIQMESSAAFGAVAGSVQQFTSSISPLGGKLMELAGKAKQAATFLATFGPGILSSRQELERYSGTIAQVFARQERQQIAQDFARARATAASVSSLGAAVHAFRENILPARIEFDKLTNNMGRLATQVANVGAIAFNNSAAMGAVKATNAAVDLNQRMVETIARGMDRVVEKVSGGHSGFFQKQLESITGSAPQDKGQFLDLIGKLQAGDFGARSRRPGGNRAADRNDPPGEFPAW